ncbi:MAG: hypothetical protein R3B09_30230 [Nannocystaceae bacterium]
MKLCPGCSRHVKRDQATCPFCQATITPPTSPLAVVTLAAGLALAGCNGDDGESTTGESTTGFQTATAYGGPGPDSESNSSTSSGTNTSSGTTDETTTSSSSSTSSTTDMSGPVSAYGGPPADTITAGKEAFAPPDADAPPSPPESDPG